MDYKNIARTLTLCDLSLYISGQLKSIHHRSQQVIRVCFQEDARILCIPDYRIPHNLPLHVER